MRCDNSFVITPQHSGPPILVQAIRIQPDPRAEAQLLPLLDSAERDRAARFRFDHLRSRFILARGSLRLLLSAHTGISPASIPFRYGPKGKPSLGVPSPIHFNVSHSGDLALFAFARELEIGIDVEQIRPISDMQQIAQRFFAPDEAANLLSLQTELRIEAFFRCWCRKEAVLKATGDGLSTPLDSFSVSLLPDQPAALLRMPPGGGAWSLHDVPAAPGYSAALAYCAAPHTLRHYPPCDAANLIDSVRTPAGLLASL